MRERRKLVELWQRGDAAALMTLVGVEGSSYRRPGARLLMSANGDYAGAISGGCLEAELLRKAQWKVREGALLERYSTLFDDTADIPYGLGCGGTVDLLLEPAATPEFTALMQAMEASLRGDVAHVITALAAGGRVQRWITDRAGATVFGERPSAVPVFEETLEAPQRLVVIGAGDDARPLVSMAALLGWTVHVVDGRAQWARRDRFAEAEEVFVCQAPAIDTARPWETPPVFDRGAQPLSAADAVVLMTHSYEQDRAWLCSVLPVKPRYLGLLGARHRSALLLAEAAAMLNWTVEQACEGVFAPIGLDLGGEGAEAIALAVVAEIQARLEGKLSSARRMTPSIIAEQIAKGGASRYLQKQCAL